MKTARRRRPIAKPPNRETAKIGRGPGQGARPRKRVGGRRGGAAQVGGVIGRRAPGASDLRRWESGGGGGGGGGESDSGKHERLRALLALGGGGALVPCPGGLHRESAPAAHQSTEPSFRQGALPGQNREGNAEPRPAIALPPRLWPFAGRARSSLVSVPTPALETHLRAGMLTNPVALSSYGFDLCSS